MKIGLLFLVEPATTEAKYATRIDEIKKVVESFFEEASEFVVQHAENETSPLSAALIRLCDEQKCPLVLTFGGTGPALVDIIPDVTLEVADRKLPGFGEVMRYYSFERFKVSVLSRAEAGVRGRSLIVNMPTRAKPVKFCLRLLQEGIVEALEQIAGLKLVLKREEVVIPIEKYLPFMRKFRAKPGPNDIGQATL